MVPGLTIGVRHRFLSSLALGPMCALFSTGPPATNVPLHDVGAVVPVGRDAAAAEAGHVDVELLREACHSGEKDVDLGVAPRRELEAYSRLRSCLEPYESVPATTTRPWPDI